MSYNITVSQYEKHLIVDLLEANGINVVYSDTVPENAFRYCKILESTSTSEVVVPQVHLRNLDAMDLEVSDELLSYLCDLVTDTLETTGLALEYDKDKKLLNLYIIGEIVVSLKVQPILC